jgi:putative transposase
VKRTAAPWRSKKYRPLTFHAKQGWTERDGMIRLSLGLTVDATGKKRQQSPLSFRTPTVTDSSGNVVKPDEWGEGQLCWDRQNRRWEWHVAYRTAAPPALDPQRTLALDPGIINSFTTATETLVAYECLVINGRAGRAIKHRRNTAVAEIVRKQSKCVKSSRQWRKYENARKRVSGKASDSLRNFDHHVARHVATVAQEADTGRVIVGDVRGIERNTARTDKRRFGKNQRRRLSQWSRGRQERYIAEKLGLKEIDR